MKPFYILFAFLSLLCRIASANPLTGATDSLKKLVLPALKQTKNLPDTTTLRQLDNLAYEFYESNPDSTAYYGELEIKLAKQINDRRGLADGSIQVASAKAYKGDYDAAERLYNAALKIYLQIGFPHGLYKCYTGLGSIQDYLGNYSKAINLYKKGLQAGLKARNLADVAECYNLIGVTYDNRGDYSNALDNYFKALKINILQKDELSAADQYCNIGVIMHELELYEKALNYYKKARKIWVRLDDVQGIGVIYQNIGEVLLDQRKYKEALPYLNYARANFNNLGDQDGISLIEHDFGLYNLRTGDVDSAIYYFNRALQSAAHSKIAYNKAKAYCGLAQAFNSKKNFKAAYESGLQAEVITQKIGSLNIKASAMQEIGTALAGLRRFEEAYNKMLDYSALRGRLKHNESIQKIDFYNLEIEFAKEQKEIAEKQQKKVAAYKQKLAEQRNLNIAYAGITLIVAVLAVVYYRGRRRQKAINAILQQKNKEIMLHQADIQHQSEKLNDLNLLKDRLIGVLAHDLRAPISTLRGLFNLLIDKSISNTEFIEMTPTVSGKLEQTSDFLDTLLFWINSQVDGEGSNVRVFNVAELLNKELEHINDKLNQKELSVMLNVNANAHAFAEPNSIRIVMHNLLINAIKFSNRGGLIEITVEEKNDRMFFCTKDGGQGMSEQHLANLFKNKVNSLPGTENETGTGMGLLFCKELIEKYNGKIWVESKLGAGSSVRFDLPVNN